jgi:adenylate cyclase
MSAPTDSHLEIAHVLFIDIVAYSKLLIDQQTELIKLLNEQVHRTEEFRSAEAAGKLIRIATGDGMALAFFTSPDAPVRCALQLSEAIRQSPRLQLRMGIHSGPVDQLADVNERSNIAGAGINTARRVMDSRPIWRAVPAMMRKAASSLRAFRSLAFVSRCPSPVCA